MRNSFFTVLGLAASVQALYAADLTGKVVLKGTPKTDTERAIDMAALSPDKFCGAAHNEPVMTRHYVVGSGGGLANVFVYVKSGASPSAAPASSPLLDQVGCLYTPYVLGAQVNQKITIKNSDATLHNVHATSIPGREMKDYFNIAQPTKDFVSEKSFDKPEVMIRFKCDVHSWMFAYVGIVEHPYFAVTDKDGNFKISGLPNGKYTVEAYHVKTHGANPGVTQDVVVDGDKKADFTVELK